MAQARVVLLVREGCHLCDDAVDDRPCGLRRDRRDVDDPRRRLRSRPAREYSDHVPVTFVDGERHAFWHVDADALARSLARA